MEGAHLNDVLGRRDALCDAQCDVLGRRDALCDVLGRRDALCDAFPGLIGRHAFYKGRRPLIVEGMALLSAPTLGGTKRLSEISTALLQASAQEQASHLQWSQTDAGNRIHATEYALYSAAFDAFQAVIALSN